MQNFMFENAGNGIFATLGESRNGEIGVFGLGGQKIWQILG
jgi:hypothetical protein